MGQVGFPISDFDRRYMGLPRGFDQVPPYTTYGQLDDHGIESLRATTKIALINHPPLTTSRVQATPGWLSLNVTVGS